jgi:hypothetical protein
MRGLKTLLAMAGSAILPAMAQQYVIATVAGGGAPRTGVRATDVALRSTVAVAITCFRNGVYCGPCFDASRHNDYRGTSEQEI